MAHEAVLTADAPAPIGPYSQAVRSEGLLFCSGQVGLDPATGNLVEGGVASQTVQAMKNIGAVLAQAGYGYGDIVKTTIFLVDMNDFAAVNEAYGTYLGSVKPARSTVAVAALPRGGRVEIEVIARK
jgi:2-iminobutanoate/2-iminopropanoate deaminase